MRATGEILKIEYQNQMVSIDVYVSQGNTIYKVNLPGDIFFITKTKTFDLDPFWTSVPEGRLSEASQIGKQIDERKPLPEQKSLF